MAKPKPPPPKPKPRPNLVAKQATKAQLKAAAAKLGKKPGKK